MKRLYFFAVLIIAGLGLAGLVAYVIGWLQAIPIPAETAKSISRSPLAANLIYLFALAALPALFIATLTGLAIQSTLSVVKAPHLLSVAVPWVWLCTVGSTWPLNSKQDTSAFLQNTLLSWQVWPSVLAVPFGLLLAAFIQLRRRQRKSGLLSQGGGNGSAGVY